MFLIYFTAKDEEKFDDLSEPSSHDKGNEKGVSRSL